MKITSFVFLFILLSNIISSQIPIPDGKIVKSISTGKIYLIIDREKREIKNTNIYNRLFKDTFGIITLSDLDNDLLPAGKPVNDGYLCKGTSEAVFLVINGCKRHIISPQIFDYYNFDWNKIRVLPDNTILKIKTGKPIETLIIPKKYPNEPLPCGVK
jgi:hypothetical protein